MLVPICKFLWRLFIVGFPPGPPVPHDCVHGYHTWTPWVDEGTKTILVQDNNEGDYTWDPDNPPYNVTILKQTRRCSICNKIDTQNVKI